LANTVNAKHRID